MKRMLAAAVGAAAIAMLALFGAINGASDSTPTRGSADSGHETKFPTPTPPPPAAVSMPATTTTTVPAA
jgi:hypothetical protein